MKEPLAIDAIGVVMSSGAWLSGISLTLRAQAVAVSRLPESWRSHPELRETYCLTAQLRVRDVLREPRRPAAWLGTLTAFALSLSLIDIPLWLSLAIAVAYAAYSTGVELARDRSALSDRRAALGLPELPSDRWLGVSYLLSLLLLKIGFYLTAVFLGYVLVHPVK